MYWNQKKIFALLLLGQIRWFIKALQHKCWRSVGHQVLQPAKLLLAPSFTMNKTCKEIYRFFQSVQLFTQCISIEKSVLHYYVWFSQIWSRIYLPLHKMSSVMHNVYLVYSSFVQVYVVNMWPNLRKPLIYTFVVNCNLKLFVKYASSAQ